MAPRRPSTAEAPPPTDTAAAAAFAAIAAPQAAATVAPAVAAAGTTVLTARAVQKISGALLNALDEFAERRSKSSMRFMQETVMDRAGGAFDTARLAKLRKLEEGYEKEHRSKQKQRVKDALPGILSIQDQTERGEKLAALFAREKKYSEMRESAMVDRALGELEVVLLEQSSPQGAYWRLSENVKDHTPDCLAMAEKFWPWPVLREYHPPLHHGCPCSLFGLDEAVEAGWMSLEQVPDPQDAQRRYRRIRRTLDEAVVEEADVVEFLEERAHPLRWGKGVDKGGQFRPRRGGSARGLLKKLLGDGPVPPARLRGGRWTWVAGKYVKVPEGRRWRREAAGRVYTSPSGGTNVYRDGVFVSGPGAPAPKGERGTRVKRRPALAPSASLQDQIDLIRDELRAPHLADAEKPDGLPVQPGDGPSGLLALKEAGFLLTASRPSTTRPGAQQLEYRLRRQNNRRLALEYADDVIGSVQWVAGPDAPRKRAEGAPNNWGEFASDVLAWSDELGELHDADVASAGVKIDAQNLSDHAGAHEWSGDILLGPDTHRDMNAAGAARLEGRPLNDQEKRGVWATMSVAGHELSHAVNPIDPDFFYGEHSSLEEALAEETGHVLAIERLIEQNQGDVLAWRDAHPDDGPVRGVYLKNRGALSDILDKAVPADDKLGNFEERRQYITDLKFEVAPEKRFRQIGHDIFQHDQSQSAQQWEAWARQKMLLTGEGPGGPALPFKASPDMAAAFPLHGPQAGDRVELVTKPKSEGGLVGQVIEFLPAGLQGRYKDKIEVAWWHSDDPDAGYENRAHVPDQLRVVAKYGEWSPALPAAPASPPRSDDPDDSFWDDLKGFGSYFTKGIFGHEHESAIEPPSERKKGKGKEPVSYGKPYKPAPPAPPPPPVTIGGNGKPTDGPLPTYDHIELTIKPKPGPGPEEAKDATGKKYAVNSFEGNQDAVANEVLSAALFRQLGVRTPPTGTVEVPMPDFAAIPDEDLGEDDGPLDAGYKRVSTGMIVMDGDDIWIYEPRGHFGGYEHTFPKGGVEPGLTQQQNAHKELWEETGLHARPVGVVGDFMGDTSVSRYYLAVKTGGEPTVGPETQAVKKVSLDEAEKLLNKDRDQEILEVLREMPKPSKKDRKAAAKVDPFPGLTDERVAVTPYVEGPRSQKPKGATAALADSYMAAALLGNWEFDKVKWEENGEPFLTSPTALGFRADGSRKSFGPIPTEVWTLKSPKGRGFSKVEMDEDEMRQRAGETAGALDDDAIDRLVNAAPFRDEGLREDIREALRARRDWMVLFSAGEVDLPGPLEGDEARGAFEDHQAKYKLMPGEVEALDLFADNHAAVNEFLKSKEDKSKAPKDVATVVKGLDSLFSYVKSIDEDAVMYAPLNMDPERLASDDLGGLVGDTFEQSGFTRGDWDADGLGESAAVMRVSLPAGQKAIDLGAIPGVEEDPGSEVVLPRRQRLRIVGRRVVDGKVQVEAVALPPAKPKPYKPKPYTPPKPKGGPPKLPKPPQSPGATPTHILSGYGDSDGPVTKVRTVPRRSSTGTPGWVIVRTPSGRELQVPPESLERILGPPKLPKSPQSPGTGEDSPAHSVTLRAELEKARLEGDWELEGRLNAELTARPLGPNGQREAWGEPDRLNALSIPDPPKFVTSNAKVKAENEAHAEKLHKFAAKGDLAGLKAYSDFSPKSGKLVKYKASLVKALDPTAAAPKPPKPKSQGKPVAPGAILTAAEKLEKYGIILEQEGSMSDSDWLGILEQAAPVVEELTAKWPKVFEGLHLRREAPKGLGVLGSYDLASKTIVIRPHISGHEPPADPTAGGTKMPAFNIGSDWASVLRHELGHHVDYNSVPPKKNRDALKKVKFEVNGKTVDTSAWGKVHVSGYSAKMTSEALGEFFAWYTSANYVKGAMPAEVEAIMESLASRA